MIYDTIYSLYTPLIFQKTHSYRCCQNCSWVTPYTIHVYTISIHRDQHLGIPVLRLLFFGEKIIIWTKKKEIMMHNMETANQPGSALPTNIPTISPSCRPIKLNSSQVFIDMSNTKEILTLEINALFKGFDVEPRKIKARIKFIATQCLTLKQVSSKVSSPLPSPPVLKVWWTSAFKRQETGTRDGLWKTAVAVSDQAL